MGAVSAERHALPAFGIEVLGRQPALEGGFQQRPLGVDGGVPRGVAVAPLAHDRLPEDALEGGSPGAAPQRATAR